MAWWDKVWNSILNTTKKTVKSIKKAINTTKKTVSKAYQGIIKIAKRVIKQPPKQPKPKIKVLDWEEANKYVKKIQSFHKGIAKLTEEIPSWKYRKTDYGYIVFLNQKKKLIIPLKSVIVKTKKERFLTEQPIIIEAKKLEVKNAAMEKVDRVLTRKGEIVKVKPIKKVKTTPHKELIERYPLDEYYGKTEIPCGIAIEYTNESNPEFFEALEQYLLENEEELKQRVGIQRYEIWLNSVRQEGIPHSLERFLKQEGLLVASQTNTIKVRRTTIMLKKCPNNPEVYKDVKAYDEVSYLSSVIRYFVWNGEAIPQFPPQKTLFDAAREMLSHLKVNQLYDTTRCDFITSNEDEYMHYIQKLMAFPDFPGCSGFSSITYNLYLLEVNI